MRNVSILFIPLFAREKSVGRELEGADVAFGKKAALFLSFRRSPSRAMLPRIDFTIRPIVNAHPRGLVSRRHGQCFPYKIFKPRQRADTYRYYISNGRRGWIRDRFITPFQTCDPFVRNEDFVLENSWLERRVPRRRGEERGCRKKCFSREPRAKLLKSVFI